MTPQTSTEIPRHARPTFADIERRRAELLGVPYQPAEEEPSPAFEQPHPPSPPPPPRRNAGWPSLAPAALHGIAGAVVDQAARDLWNGAYEALSEPSSGLYGAATRRAEAQVLRLSAIYAALDSNSVMKPPHLQAALAVWELIQSRRDG